MFTFILAVCSLFLLNMTSAGDLMEDAFSTDK